MSANLLVLNAIISCFLRQPSYNLSSTPHKSIREIFAVKIHSYLISLHFEKKKVFLLSIANFEEISWRKRCNFGTGELLRRANNIFVFCYFLRRIGER